MSANLRQIAKHWDDIAESSQDQLGLHWWEAGPEIQKHINRVITGDPDQTWIQYAVRCYGQSVSTSEGNVLVLGCGSGGLERNLSALGAFHHCDSFDISIGAIISAREQAAQAGIRNISYAVADVSTLHLPPRHYKSVWIQAALHHFEALEDVYEQIKHTLAPDGLLFLFEYVGPNRFQFPTRQKQIAQACLQLLPERYRQIMPAAVQQATANPLKEQSISSVGKRALAKLQEGTLAPSLKRRLQWRNAARHRERPLKTEIDFPTVSGVVSVDPSEAIRSEEIVEKLEHYFEIVERKDWGGNIIQFLLANIAGNFANGSDEARRLLQMLLNIEQTLLEAGEFTSDYTFIVARPKHSVV